MAYIPERGRESVLNIAIGIGSELGNTDMPTGVQNISRYQTIVQKSSCQMCGLRQQLNTKSYWHKIKYLTGRQYSEIQTSRLEVVIGRSVQRLSGSVTAICVKGRALNLELINCARLAIGR